MNVVVVVDKWDATHLDRLKKLLGSVNIRPYLEPVTLLFTIEQIAAVCKTTKVVCSSLSMFKKLVAKYHKDIGPDEVEKLQTTSDFQGSMFFHKSYTGETLEILIVPPCQHIAFRPEYKWLIPRWFQKLSNPDFPNFPKFQWEYITEKNFSQWKRMADTALFIGIDIETVKEELDSSKLVDDPIEYRGIWSTYEKGTGKNKRDVYFTPKITFCSYTLVHWSTGTAGAELVTTTGVIQVNELADLKRIGELNATEAAKIFQNGGYDNSYFLRFNIPCRNYLWDTFIMMHSWLVELPRDLSFIASLFNKQHMYWKDQSGSNMAEYNARDTHNMTWAFIYMLQEFPKWAKDNYAENFRMQFPCIHAGMEGFLVDQAEVRRLRQQAEVKVNTLQYILETITGAPGINVNSPIHMPLLLRGLGMKTAKNCDSTTLQDFRNKSIIWDYVGKLIEDIRETRKAVSTYFKPALMGGRFLYEINPAGTLTGRMASKASNFWCGSNIQNQPSYVKSIYIADPGYNLNDTDNKQSESRCTAYISEDANLMRTVEDPKDFHKNNATLFFGLPFEKITKEIRKVAKTINHGANYNMGDWLLLQEMGIKYVLQTKRLLGLPSKWRPQKVCEYLLTLFSKAYPDVKGKYYSEVISSVNLFHRLVGATGWTRICFADPTEKKAYLNEYVAHPPQSLSVKSINAAWFDCWLELQLKQRKLRFKAQVHDSLMWQDKPEDTAANSAYISERMARPIVVNGRSMVIPNDPMLGKQSWAQLKEE